MRGSTKDGDGAVGDRTIRSGTEDEMGPAGSAGPRDDAAQPARVGVRATVAGVAVFLLAVPFALLVMLVTSESEWVERLDRGVADSLNDLVLGTAGAAGALEVIGRVSEPWWLRAVALVVAIVIGMRGRRRAAAWLVVTVVVGGLVGLGLKLLVQRARPVFDEPVYVATGYSFPSGHALNSMLIVTALLVVLWPVMGRAGRILGAAGGAVIVLVVGLDRIALGVHYLTDVVAGWAVGLAVVAGTAAAFVPRADAPAPRLDRRPLTWPRALGRMLARLLLGWAAILTLMVGLGLLVTRVAADRWPLTEEDSVNEALEAGRTPMWDSLTLAMRHIGDTPVVIITMLVGAVVIRIVLGRWREGLFVIAATAGQALVFVATTALVERSRPEVEHLDESPPTSSFPSGHTGAALALYVSLATVVIRAVRRTWLRVLVAGLFLVPPLLVAYARLYRGMHHPSDLAGSLVNASLCVWLAARVVLHEPLPEDRRADDEARPQPAPDGRPVDATVAEDGPHDLATVSAPRGGPLLRDDQTGAAP